MKRRNTQPPNLIVPANAPPVPAQPTSETEAAYATVIAQVIREGMPGDLFAYFMYSQYPEAVKAAAGMSYAECVAWFRKDAQAAAILDAVPLERSEPFFKTFHAHAQRLTGAC